MWVTENVVLQTSNLLSLFIMNKNKNSNIERLVGKLLELLYEAFDDISIISVDKLPLSSRNHTGV